MCVFLQSWLTEFVYMHLFCVCLCVREKESWLLLKVIYSINHSIWFLFIFRSCMVTSATHWALYALPRLFPSTNKTVFGYNLERRAVPALLRYFMVPCLYGEIPSDLFLVKLAVCRHAGIPASYIHWFISALWACFKWLQTRSCVELIVIIIHNLENRAKYAASSFKGITMK